MDKEGKKVDFVIITGLSGAGKTQAIRYFEDIGFFCIDNLPTTFIPSFAKLCMESNGKIQKVALVIDIREREFFEKIYNALQNLEEMGCEYKIIFLEADTNVLVRRFSQTRRRHPLDKGKSTIIEEIEEERERLKELRKRAHLIIDTSYLTPQALYATIRESLDTVGKEAKLTITLLSFGYKWGIPQEADLVFDLRFLPNPYYNEELRALSGHDKKVIDFILSAPISKDFLQKLLDFIKFLIPQYIMEGKSYLTIAFGCTGGKHRSIAVVDIVADAIRKECSGINLLIKHRDFAKE